MKTICDRQSRRALISLVSVLLIASARPASAAGALSHAAIRELPPVSGRPLAPGPARHVDAKTGDDANTGSAAKPWRTINHALTQLDAGETLCLRGGIYYETVRCSLAGAPDRPITIRSCPGERVVIDGGLPEFFAAPGKAWIPVADGAPGEYRSARKHRNLTGVAGMFGDSGIGLHTYWLLGDLRARNEKWSLDPGKKIFDQALYGGPGLWYDERTGHLHCRLAHTHNAHPQVADYAGETDPRKLPLVIAPLAAVPLHLTHARHVRVQDLVLRGGGEHTVLLEYCTDVELEGVVIQCGSLEGRHSGPVKVTHSAVFGRIPPWMWRIDSSKGCASGASRDVARLVTPTLLETSHGTGAYSLPRAVYQEVQAGRPGGRCEPPMVGDAARSPQMIHHPGNHDWEISWCEFTDGHDGVFLVGRNMRFHHNLVDNMQDDAVDISCALPRPDDTMFITRNWIRRCVTGISTHNYDIPRPRGRAWVGRNVIDQSQGVQWMRSSDREPEGKLSVAGTLLLHGSDHCKFVESVYFYHNTCLAPMSGLYAFAQRTMFHLKPGSERRVFNNIFVYLNDTGRYPPPFYGMNVTNLDLQIDGNLHWNPHPAAVVPPKYLDKLRDHALSKFNQEKYPPGFGANDLVGDPQFVRYQNGPGTANDYRLAEGSPATGKGVPIPGDWPDAFRPVDGARPDLGALPVGSPPESYGVRGRVKPVPDAPGKVSRRD